MLSSNKQALENPRGAMISPALLEKLCCVNCEGVLHAHSGQQYLECAKCHAPFPIVQGRFPDFLNASQREKLSREIAFWHSHFDGKVYQDENDQSYRRIMELMQVRESDEVIELGCGSGALLTRLPARFRVGIEPAEGLLTATKGFDAVIGTAERLPFRSGSFDVVYFKHSLHHVEDKETAIKEGLRITRPGGQFAVCEPNLAHPQRRLTANPQSILRKWHILTHFIGPVETFQTAEEVIAVSQKYGGNWVSTRYYESSYDRLTLFQALQRIYSRVLWPFVNQRYLLPNYFLAFRKAG